MSLPTALEHDLMKRGFTRRSFGRIATLLSAGATLPFYNETALAQISYSGEVPSDAVMINANENPLGPCREALEAMSNILPRGGRYGFGETFRLAETLAAQEGVPSNHVQAFAGSSDPLHRVVLAFSSPSRALVVGDPGYEAGERAANFAGARTIKVPLTKGSYAHDVKAMVKEGGPAAGVFYICNPNNPTGTLTPHADIEWLLANKPEGSIVLLDEAYIHFTTAPRAAGLVAKGKDLVVLRTFSKIYGMAGLRAGVAIARPDLLDRIRPYGTGFLPVTGMVGATASLQSKTLVDERRRIVKDTREEVMSWLTKRGHAPVPSESNCFMVDVRRPGHSFAQAMAREKVYVGRTWPVWPNHVRVTIGTPAEMARFKQAFEKVMA